MLPLREAPAPNVTRRSLFLKQWCCFVAAALLMTALYLSNSDRSLHWVQMPTATRTLPSSALLHQPLTDGPPPTGIWWQFLAAQHPRQGARRNWALPSSSLSNLVPLIVPFGFITMLFTFIMWSLFRRVTCSKPSAMFASSGSYWGEDGFFNPATYATKYGLGYEVKPIEDPDDELVKKWAEGSAEDELDEYAESVGAPAASPPPPSASQRQPTPRSKYSSNDIAVRRLPTIATAEQLRDWFAGNGVKVVMVELLPDIFNTPSGFAILTVAPGHVDAALSLNRTFFLSSERPIEIGHADSPLMRAALLVKDLKPIFTKEELSRLVVLTSLPADVTREQIVTFLQRGGAEAEKVEILPERPTQRGRALVFLKDASMQAKALALNGMEIYEDGRWIDVRHPMERFAKDCMAEARGLADFNMPSTDPRVMVSGLPWDTDETRIAEFFTNKGLSVSRVMMLKMSGNKPCGRAIVTFADVENRDYAIKASGEYYFDSGRWLRITPYQTKENRQFMKSLQEEWSPKKKKEGLTPMGENHYVMGYKGEILGRLTMGGKIDKQDIVSKDILFGTNSSKSWQAATRPSGGTRTLYFANLSWDVDDNVLWNAVEEVTGEGSVTHVRLVNDPVSGRFQGYGFVTFRRVHDADDAMEKLQGRGLYGRPVRIDYHLSREKRPELQGLSQARSRRDAEYEDY